MIGMWKYFILLPFFLLFDRGVLTCSGQKIIGYYPSYRDGMHNQIQFSKMTDVYFAFLNFNANTGALDFSNVGALNNLITAAKNSNPSIRIHLSTGGGAFGTTGFNTLVANTTAMNNFVSNMADYIELRNLDGWNLDWEYPYSIVDINNHEKLVKAMRAELQAKELTMCKQLDLSLAVDGVSSGVNLNLTTIGFVDYIIVMSYDAPNFIADNHSSYAMAQAALDGWYAWGVPYNKMLLAVPFYGWDYWRNTASTYSQIANPAPATAYNSTTDFYNNSYYNAVPTLRSKADLSMRTGKKTLGIAIWEIGQDRAGLNYSLLDAIYNKFITDYSLTTTLPNPCAMPVDFVDVQLLNNIQQLITIQWTTANASEIVEYKVLRSNDGVNFNIVGSVPSLSGGSGNYSFDDVSNKSNGTYYYKIIGVDIGGQNHHSPIVNIKCCQVPLHVIPASNSIEIFTSDCIDKEITVTIFDVTGKVYYSGISKSIQDSIRISTAGYKQGLYIVQFTLDNKIEKHTIVIQ